MTTYTAQALLEEFWDMKVPIKPEYFAEKLGLSVVKKDLGYRSGYLDEDKKTIFVNEKEIPERQRFTIAHELGHHCLGHGSAERNTVFPSGAMSYDPVKESAANRFAADLIMPAIAIKALIEKVGIKDPVRLRQVLGVSSQALNLRLAKLGYFL